MGYHNAVEQHKTAVRFANKAINDRERYRFALITTLKAIGLEHEIIDQIISDVRSADFTTLYEAIRCL